MRRLVFLFSATVAAGAMLQAGQVRRGLSGSQVPGGLLPGTATVVGRVIEADTDIGIPGAIVTLSSPALGTGAERFVDGTPGGSRRLLADAHGRFAFGDLPAGAYAITAQATGYVDGPYGPMRLVQLSRGAMTPLVFELQDRDRPATVVVPMWKLGGIDGMVSDELGAPIVGVPVSVLPRVADRTIMQRAAASMTDDRGRYHVDVVPGTYAVAVLAGATTIPGAGGAELIYPTTFHPSATLPVGASSITVASGEERGGIDLALAPASARRVSGHVTYLGDPVPSVAVKLLSADPTVVRPGSAIDAAQTISDAKGEFAFDRVTPGLYRVCAVQTAEDGHGLFYWSPDAVAVGDTDLLSLAIALQEGVRISGHIEFDTSTRSRPTQDAMRAMMISPQSDSGCVGAAARSRTLNYVDDSGRFTTQSIPPGPYLMTVTGIPAGWVLESVTIRGTDATDRPFELSGSGVSDMVVTITDRISVLSGTVRDVAGQVPLSAVVAVFPASRALWPPPGLDSRRARVSIPSRDGRYTFRGLPAGEYFVTAVAGSQVDLFDVGTLSFLSGAATRVDLAAGESRTLNIAFRNRKEP